MNRLAHSVKCLSLLFTTVLVLSILFQSCEPGGDITFQNLQNQEVTIFFIHVRADGSLDQPSRQGVIPPNTTKKFSDVFLGSEWVERIEARDQTGKIIFSHDYKMDDLEKINWKIIIPP